MLIFLLACSQTEPAVAAPPRTGAEVYAQTCAQCHGATGKGDGPAAVGLTPPPKDISRPRLEDERRPPSREQIMRTGSPGTAMVGYAAVLPPEELEAVIIYVHTMAHSGD